MKRLRLFIPLLLFAVVLAVGFVGFSLDDQHLLPSALLQKPFPEFSAPGLYEPQKSISRADIVGRPALVNVWATWCPTCKAEHEELMRIAQISDVFLVGLNYKDVRSGALGWLADYGDPYDIVLSDSDGRIGVDLGVYGAPETFLLNAEGVIVYKRVGEINRRIWQQELKPRLRALGVATQSAEQLKSMAANDAL